MSLKQTGIVRTIAVLSVICALVSVGAMCAYAAPNAEFKADGSIMKGGTTIRLSSKGDISLANVKGDEYLISNYNYETSSSRLDTSFKVDAAGKTATFTSGFTTPKHPEPIRRELTLSLTDAGKARISLRYLTDVPIQQILTESLIFMQSESKQLAGDTIRVGDENFVIPAVPNADPQWVWLYSGAPKTVTYLPEDASRRIIFTPVKTAKVGLADSNGDTSRAPYMELRFDPQDNQIVFDVEFGFGDRPLSAETYYGVDYYASDKFHLPRYGLSRNLVQNSGFEQGLHYWRNSSGGVLTEPRFDDYYQVVPEGAFKGRQCLKIQGQKGQTPSAVSTLAIPVEAGATYTVSFYARADRPGMRINLGSITAKWLVFPMGKAFELTPEWKRYSVSFEAPNSAVSLNLSVDSPPVDCTVWLDAVQFEKGELTDYTEKPLSATVVTSQRNNLFQPDDKVNAHADIVGFPGTRGSLSLKATDFFGNLVHQGKSTFTVGADGITSQNLPWAEGLAPGLYLIETDVNSDDGFSDRDFFRISIMKFQDNTSQHKNLFAMRSSFSEQGGWARKLDFYRKIGIGSMVPFDPNPDLFRQLMATNRITGVSSIFRDGIWSGNWNLKDDYAKLNDADLKTVEENAYQRAKAFPDVKYWKLINEPDTGDSVSVEEMKLFIRPLVAARRGLLRANPDAIVLSPDPWNMQPLGGTRWIDTFLSAGGKAACDQIAIHTYRASPEEPDLDSDTATFLAMLARHDYHDGVWFTEGGGNFHMNIPAFGMNVYKSLSQEGTNWRAGWLTYDMGWGERIAAAYAMRYWLVGLKYGDRIKQQAEEYFRNNASIDLDMTPGAEAFSPNVLSQVLGNSTYRQDVALGLNTRCYVFEDGQKRPVAALWSYDPKVDRDEVQGPVFDISRLPADVELIDFMGRVVKRQATLQLSPFPSFLRGQPGTSAVFTETLKNAEMRSGDARQVVAYAQVISTTQAELHLQNLLSRPAQGQLRVLQGDKPLYDAGIAVPDNESWKLPIAMPESQSLSRKLPLKISFQPTGGTEQTMEVNLESLLCRHTDKPPVIDGDLSDWPADTALALPPNFMEFKIKDKSKGTLEQIPWHGPADLSGILYSAWDENNLYLAVKVRDDVFTPADALITAYEGDSLQIYFDSWNNGRAKAFKGFKGYDGDDHVFAVWPSPQGVKVNREVAPDTQFAFLKTGIVPAIKSAFKRTADGYIIEMAFPAREITPLPLTPGTAFGFAILINDTDGQGRKRGLTVTPNGTEPYMSPDIYPTMILAPAK